MQKVGNLNFMRKYEKDTYIGNGFLLDHSVPALPFHILSTGITTVKKGNFSHQKGAIRPYLEILWCISGSGEVTLFGQQYQMNENDVFYYLPGEDHERKAFSRQ